MIPALHPPAKGVDARRDANAQQSFSDQHPKLTTALLVASMMLALLLGPTHMEFWVALLLLAILGVSFTGRVG
jgi:hypothetical protein